MSSAVLTVIGAVLALAAAIVAWIMIVPEKKRPGLNKFFQYIHDLFNFKSLWLEKILKFLYIFETLSCIICGFLLLFSFDSYSGMFYSYTRWNGWYGLLLMILGPIAARILFEFMMMIILLVKNTMEINDKLNAQPGSRFEEKLLDKKQKEEQAALRAQQREAARQQAANAAYMQQQYQQYSQYQQQYAQPTQPTDNTQPVQPEEGYSDQGGDNGMYQ